ncbi:MULTISPECIES: Ger(x)C family spore germination protein [Neobacillus]|jgi:spore germination protein|uniref:Ger(X)C family spore germination protein n=1 Tax=Neobacillus sedimentimangrovi TaxID=2699460 RepID=A0ABS8QHP0_9BACI|nr:Ger(x)C family spore germination protein [Neobacillus sedimentimangrovi]MCD4838520.1 Ger(x)C family spore germination protein [Neobacillus sedimentimangrovi]
MKKVQLWVLLIIIVFATGCVEKEILDDVNLETGAGYDYIDKKVRGTALVPVYLPEKTVQNNLFTASSNLSRDFLRDVQRQSSDPIVTGSLEIVLFGEKMAKKGIVDIIDAFQRDASIGTDLYLAVTEGPSKKILEGNYSKRGNAIYLSNLIRQNIKTRDVPKTNLHLFLSSYYQKGKTAYLPTIRSIGKNKIEISGISLFKGDRVVDTLPAKQMFFFKLLVDNYSKGTFKVDMKSERAAVESIRSKYKMRLISRKPLTVGINIKVRAILIEYSGAKVTPKEIKEIEKALNEIIERECTKLIKRFQEKGIDPVGLGHFVKSRTRKFDFKTWEQTGYSNLKVNVKSDVMITEFGVIE